MLPVNPGGHAAYQNFVVTNLRKYYPDPDAFSRATWDIIERFWNLDLSYTDELLRSKYSVFGPKPRTPSCMQRSYLLSIDFKVHSLTDWAAQLKINPLYAILSGFEFGDTPGVGTFYDFLSRLWDSEDSNLSSHLRPAKEKRIKKPAHKGTKAEPVEKVSVDQLLEQLETTSFVLDDQPYSSLFKIYHREFLSQSIAKGPSPVMGHLLSLPQGSASILPATVRKKESRIVPVTVSFPSRTAILDGILPENAFILATTYICLSPPTRKATFLFSLC